MEINVWNMPINTLYRFDTNKYIWTTMLSETRGGTRKGESGALKITEVYEITDGGYIGLVASGELTIPLEKDGNNEFEIFDYDKEKAVSFKATMHLQEVSFKELSETRDAIARNYRK